jgi:hypothetical protein
MYRILYTAIKNSTGRGDQNVQRLHVDADVKMARKKKKMAAVKNIVSSFRSVALQSVYCYWSCGVL